MQDFSVFLARFSPIALTYFRLSSLLYVLNYNDFPKASQ